MGYEVFRGKVAIVTGAASGLGRGFATEIARAGGTVVAADIHQGKMAEVVDGIVASGGKAEAHAVDVRDAAAVTALVDGTVARHGRLDYIFNNAGIATQGPVEEIPVANWDEIVDINLKGVIYGTAAAYRHMVKQRSGHIVNTASLAGLVPSPLLVPYSTVKFAVVGLCDSLRLEAEAHGVSVTALCPGFIESGIYGAARTTSGFSEEVFRGNLPFLVPLDKGVRRLLDGVVARKRTVTLPFYAKPLIWMYRLFPGLTQRVNAGLVARQLASARKTAN